MSSKLVPANPADVMVIRTITPNIVTFSVPFARFGKIKIGGRGTLGIIVLIFVTNITANVSAVRLSSGSLAVFSPVALTQETRAKVDELGGNVRYIIALDFEHHLFISEWATAFPDAVIVGPEGLQEKRAAQDDSRVGNEKFDVVFNKQAKSSIKIGHDFDTDFDYEYVDGHTNRELVFNYKPDKTLIEADLLFNLPAIEQYSRVPRSDIPKSGLLDKMFTSIQSPGGDAKWMQRMNWYLIATDRKSYNQSIATINSWDFDKIIPCHGETVEKGGKALYEKVFAPNMQAAQ